MSTIKQFFNETTEQSTIKAKIVSDYFWAWAKVIIQTVKKSQRNRIAYIDLFAGPGRYKDGTKSTPLLVLEKAIQEPDMCEMRTPCSRLSMLYPVLKSSSINLQSKTTRLGMKSLRCSLKCVWSLLFSLLTLGVTKG
jgi:hypothetical protein